MRLLAPIEQALALDPGPARIATLIGRLREQRPAPVGLSRLPDAFVESCIRAHPRIIIEPSGLCERRGLRWSLPGAVLRVLREHGEPMHVDDIARCVNERRPADRPTNGRSVGSALYGPLRTMTVRVGKGRFGLTEWGLPGDRWLGDAAYGVLAKAGSPMTATDLRTELAQTRTFFPASLFPLIRNDPRIAHLGFGIYAARSVVEEPAEDGNGASVEVSG